MINFKFSPGELTSKHFFMTTIGKPCLATNCLVTKECDAPESNSTTAGWELTKNIPNITFGPS